jgi:hypothetical protein
MKTNKQLTPKQLIIYVYKINNNTLELDILGRYKDKTYGTKIIKTAEMSNSNWNFIKKYSIWGICNSMYLISNYNINIGIKSVARKVNTRFLIKNKIILPKKNIYPIKNIIIK